MEKEYNRKEIQAHPIRQTEGKRYWFNEEGFIKGTVIFTLDPNFDPSNLIEKLKMLKVKISEVIKQGVIVPELKNFEIKSIDEKQNNWLIETQNYIESANLFSLLKGEYDEIAETLKKINWKKFLTDIKTIYSNQLKIDPHPSNFGINQDNLIVFYDLTTEEVLKEMKHAPFTSSLEEIINNIAKLISNLDTKIKQQILARLVNAVRVVFPEKVDSIIALKSVSDILMAK